MSVEYTIVCDTCGRTLESRKTNAAEARVRIRLNGGRTSLPGGKDMCGPCVAGRKAEATE